MVSLSASEMDKLYKNETIFDHKDKMIDKLKEKMTEIQLNIDLANAKKQGSRFNSPDTKLSQP